MKIRQKYIVEVEYEGLSRRDESWLNQYNLELVLTKEQFKLTPEMIKSIKQVE